MNSVFISGCIFNSNDNDTEIDTDIVIGMISNISGFYPWMSSRDNPTLAVNVNLFNCLVEVDPISYKFVAALAENWNNPDGVTWRFFLRKGVQFHNGNLFTAEDVKFTIEYMRNMSYFSQELETISDIVIVDNYTIDIITKYPSPTLLYKLGTLYILSEGYMRTIESMNDTWPIGTGAYKLVEYVPGNHIMFDRFDDYWKGQPEVKEVTFKKFNNSKEMKNALMNGEIDICSLAVEDFKEIQNTSGFIVKSVESPGVIYLGFDFRVNDSYGFKGLKNPVSDIRVRTAMYHAINIDTIIEKNLMSAATPASQFLTPYTFGYNPDISRLPYDLELAKELMREAGYEAGFTIELDSLNSGKWINVTNEIATQLSEINITIILNPQPASIFYQKLYEKNTSLYITGFNPLEAEGLIKLLLQTSNMTKGSGVWNYGNYSNPEVDRLTEIISYTMDTEMRGRDLKEIFSLAALDIAWIPLFSTKQFYGMIDEIDWTPSPSSFYWVEEISFNK